MPDKNEEKLPLLLPSQQESWLQETFNALGLAYFLPVSLYGDSCYDIEKYLLEALKDDNGTEGNPQIVAERLTARIIERSMSANKKGMDKIVQTLSEFRYSDSAVMKEAVQIALKAVYATHTYPEDKRKENAAQPGAVTRVPSEITTHLLALIRKEAKKPGLESAKVALLEKIGGQAKERILSHRQTAANTRSLLNYVIRRLKDNDMGELADQTDTLLKQMCNKDQDSFTPLTRLHDAIYNRVLDSNFIADLVHNTPKPVLKSAQLVKAGLGKFFEVQVEGVKECSAEAIHTMLNEDKRFWLPECQALMEFTDGPCEDAVENLNKFLSAPTRTGYDAIAVPMMVVRICNTMKYLLNSQYSGQERLLPNTSYLNSFFEYMQQADRKYKILIQETNRAHGPEGTEPENPNAPGIKGIEFGRTEIPKNAHAGITLDYQPASIRFEEGTNKIPSDRPADLYVPRLQEPSQSQRDALERGIPVVGGVSGSASLGLFFLKYLLANLEGVDRPDPKNYMLATTMFLNYDGGHSIHEALWSGHMVDRLYPVGSLLGLAKEDPDGNPSDELGYVSDLNEFMELFDGTETGTAMERASKTAFDATLDYFDANSIYSSDKEL